MSCLIFLRNKHGWIDRLPVRLQRNRRLSGFTSSSNGSAADAAVVGSGGGSGIVNVTGWWNRRRRGSSVTIGLNVATSLAIFLAVASGTGWTWSFANIRHYSWNTRPLDGANRCLRLLHSHAYGVCPASVPCPWHSSRLRRSRRLHYSRDVHGNGIHNGNGNPMGMGIKHRIGNGREWETTSVGMGITYTPMGIYSQRFYAAMSLLSY